MIKITEIQKLNISEDSLNQLQQFLTQPLSHEHYQMAFYRYLEIAYALELYSTVIDLGRTRINEIKHLDHTIYDEKIIFLIIESSLKLEAYDVARYFITLRKKYLTILNSYLNLYDEIKYAQKLNLPYHDFLLKLEKENIEDSNEKARILEQILLYYFNNKEFDKALEYIEKLKQFDLESQFKPIEYEIYLKKEMYSTLKEHIFEDIRANKVQTIFIVYLIKAYTMLGELDKASDLEAEYEQSFDSLPLEQRQKAYETIVELYKLIKHKVSLEMYTKKLSRVKKEITKLKQKEEPELSSIVDEVPVKEVVYLNPLNKEQIITKSNSQNIEILNELLLYSFSLPYDMKLREVIRLLLIKAQKHLLFDEVVLYLDNNETNFYHYKKERLYDKYLINHLIKDTWIEEVINQEVLIVEKNKINLKMNVVTQKEYLDDIKSIYGFSFGKNYAVLFHYEEEVTDFGKYYDLLTGLVTIIELIIKDQNKHLNLMEKIKFNESFLTQESIPVRIISSFQSEYNHKAQTLFGLEKRTHYETFTMNINSETLHDYKLNMAYLRQEGNRHYKFSYMYNDKYIDEYAYSFDRNNETEVVSIFIDNTPFVIQNMNLYNIATTDQKYNISNYHQFTLDIDNYLNDKSTFCLIELNVELKSIYGHEMMSLYFKEFAHVTSAFFEDAKTYIYDHNQLMVVLPYNDVRRVHKDINTYLNFIKDYKQSIIKGLLFDVHVGVLRYPVVTEEKKLSKLKLYFDIALEKAKLNPQYDYEFFMFSDYETYVIEDQMIHQIDRAIENYLLDINFEQIIKISGKTVWQYETKLVFENLNADIKYLYTIAKKRKRLKQMEFYLIEKVGMFLQKLGQETNKLIKLIIPISKETFLDKDFNNYLLSILKKYNIPTTFISIKTDATFKSVKDQLKIDELLLSGIDIITTNIDMLLLYNLQTLYIKYNSNIKTFETYISSMLELATKLNTLVIVDNVKNSKERDLLQNIGVDYIKGSLYRVLSEEVLIKMIKDTTHNE